MTTKKQLLAENAMLSSELRGANARIAELKRQAAIPERADSYSVTVTVPGREGDTATHIGFLDLELAKHWANDYRLEQYPDERVNVRYYAHRRWSVDEDGEPVNYLTFGEVGIKATIADLYRDPPMEATK